MKTYILGSIVILFLGIKCGKIKEPPFETIKYYGEVKYHAGDKDSTLFFQITDQLKINELDSILDFLSLSISSGTRIYAKNYVDFYRVLQNGDTICYFTTITKENFAYTDQYSNCETGILRSRTTSFQLPEFFIRVFSNYGVKLN